MSKFEYKDGDKKGYLRDVVFCYVQLQNPVANRFKPDHYREYIVDCIVDEDTADAWEESFPQNKARKVKTDEFEAIYKIAPPYPTEKKQYAIKLKVGGTFSKDYKEWSKGDLVPYDFKGRPKVLVPVEGGVKDITMDVLVSNGSKGDASFVMQDAKDFGVFPKLSAILVNDLIEYVPEGGTAFGVVVNSEEATEKGKQQKAKPSGRTEEKAQYGDSGSDDNSGFDDFDDDSIPF